MNKTPNWTIAVATLAALCAVLLAATMPAWAQDQEQAEAVADPPGRVGRISALVGAVDISRYAGDAWERAQINQPVTSRTALRSPPGSQAEVRIGSTSVRLDADTQAVFSQLDDHAIAIDVAQGTVRVRLRNLPTGDAFSLSADAVRAEAQGPGDYRVSYDPDLRAYTLRALAGELRVVTPTNSYNLEAGQESLVKDGGQSVQLHAMGVRDDFDAWTEARDGQQDALSSARYVSPETTGIEALDEHGRWNVTEEYGPVWYPRTVPSGWAPYRYGHWAHVHPWGWTWVDDAPWGFAPFHYGRWALVDSRWGWVPGPMVARPVWSPALVGYVGGYSGGVSVSIGIGSPVGWFPLGPHEIYHPPFRYSQRYWDHVNRRHKHRDHRDHRDGKRRHDDDWRHDRGRDRDGHGDRDDRRMKHHTTPGYRYAKRADALTVVRADDFRASRPVGSERLRLDAGQIAQLAPMAPGVRLPTVLPQLGSNAAAGGPVSPVLRLPAPPRRERAESPGRDGGGGALARERNGESPRNESRRGPRERDDADGDRRMVVRPPASTDDTRLGRGERGVRNARGDGSERRNAGDRGDWHNRQTPAERAARSDRDSRLQPVPGLAPAVTPLPGRAVISAPPPTAPGRSVQPPLRADRPRATEPSLAPAPSPSSRPSPALTPRYETPPRREVTPLPERRMQAPRGQGSERPRMERAPAQQRTISAPPPSMRIVPPSRAAAPRPTAPMARPAPAASPRGAMQAPRGAGGRALSGGQGGGSRGSRAAAR